MAADTDDGPFGDMGKFTAREPDSYAEAVRQREILKISSEVNELFVETKDELERGELDIESRRGIVRAAVERLIMDVEHIVKAVGGDELLHERELFTVRLSPPDKLIGFMRSDDVDVLGNPDLSPKVAGTINGLLGYLDAPEKFTAEWTVQVDIQHHEPQPVPATAEVRMPVQASRETFRAIRSFLAAVELDLGPKLPPYMGDEGPGI